MSDKNEWIAATKEKPCCKCGKDSWCTTNESINRGVCRRKPEGKGKIDQNGDEYWTYSLKQIVLPPLSKEAALIEIRHKGYCELLNLLTLEDLHREDLKKRKLTDEYINQAEYRSLPSRGRAKMARSLVEKVGLETAVTIPGIIKKRGYGGDEYITLAGSPGLLIPVRTPGGQIHSLQVRSEKQRYSLISSKKYNGSGPGLTTHVPRGVGPTADIVRLTEGSLKSDVATALSDMKTIGLPGISNYKTALPVLKKLGVQKIIFAPDADFRTNAKVTRSIVNCVEALLSEGYCVELETWGEKND